MQSTCMFLAQTSPHKFLTVRPSSACPSCSVHHGQKSTMLFQISLSHLVPRLSFYRLILATTGLCSRAITFFSSLLFLILIFFGNPLELRITIMTFFPCPLSTIFYQDLRPISLATKGTTSQIDYSDYELWKKRPIQIIWRSNSWLRIHRLWVGTLNVSKQRARRFYYKHTWTYWHPLYKPEQAT